MDRVETYKAAVRKLVDEILAMFPTADNLEVIPILDEERGHYLIYNDGWYNHRRHYANVLHLEVKPEGKVYLRHDGTNLEIANLLLEAGIPKPDIVLAFRSPDKRELLGFGVK